jgi:NAD(P)-dependent dehydrogenase (short-subunit alcohol dehydrogenase family)
MGNPNLFDLTGRVAVVTGGSKGLGKAMARGFAQAGADVVISSRHTDELEKALPEILEGTGRRGLIVTVDLSKRSDAERLAKTALEQMGRVDILVNNAGTNVPSPIDQVKDEDWDRVIELNLGACMVLTRALVPQMKERRWGRIIHISSVLGLGSKVGRNVYSATKRAVIGLAQASALDLGPFGITVNCIAPGPFLTDLPLNLLSDAEKQTFSNRTALGRWGKPEEMAGPALLLASEAGSYITGEVLVVDGGVMAHTL